MPLNADQEATAEAVFNFLLGSAKEYTVSGPPGVGKTYMLQQIVEKIMPYYKQACQLMGHKIILNRVQLCATTNRAAEVLTESIKEYAMTIHSFLNLKVNEDFETGEVSIKKTLNFQVYSNTLIIIDEASMIDRKLYAILHEATDSTCKILYVGDSFQLPPVRETLSPVFANGLAGSALTIPVRNASQPALMALCDQLRETVRTGVFAPLRVVPGVVDHLSGPEFEQHVQQVFHDEGADSRILAYTNKTVIAYNSYIRALRGYSFMLSVGEYVINNSAVSLTKRVNIHAEREFIVEQVDTKILQYKIGDASLQAYKVTIKAVKNGETFTVFQAIDPAHYKQLLKYFKKHAEWRNFFELKNMFPDLRSRDASTVYKAQGSTFGSVYIDLSDIGDCRMADQTARMLYVAVSRARSHVYLYGSLPAKYGGI